MLKHEILLERAKRNLKLRVDETLSNHERKLNLINKQLEEDLNQINREYEISVNRINLELKSIEVKQASDAERERIKNEREQLRIANANLKREKLEADLQKQRTAHLPERFNDYRDIMK